MKTLLIFLLSVSTAIANPNTMHNGAYAGLGINQSFLTGKLQSTRENIVDIKYVKMGNNKIMPELFMGWGGIWGNSPIYLGLEGFGSYNKLGASIHRYDAESDAEADKEIMLRNTIGGVARIGFVCDKFLITSRLGLVRSNFRSYYKHYDQTTEVNHANRWGRLAGAEIAYILSPDWTASLKYDYIMYNNIHLSHETVDVSYKPTVHNIGLKLAYRF